MCSGYVRSRAGVAQAQAHTQHARISLAQRETLPLHCAFTAFITASCMDKSHNLHHMQRPRLCVSLAGEIFHCFDLISETLPIAADSRRLTEKKAHPVD